MYNESAIKIGNDLHPYFLKYKLCNTEITKHKNTKQKHKPTFSKVWIYPRQVLMQYEQIMVSRFLMHRILRPVSGYLRDVPPP